MTDAFDLFIVGAGIAGLTAAHEASNRGLRVCIAEQTLFGGLVLNVNHLRPGLDGLPQSGAELASDLLGQALDLGATLLSEPVSALVGGGDRPIGVETASGRHPTRSVIVASGATLRRLGIPGEQEFEERGVSHCADCDGPLYAGQAVAVVGGGDSALQEALVLAGLGVDVVLVHRGEAFSARPDLVEAVANSARIRPTFGTVADEILGDDAVSGIRLRDLVSGETRVEPCRGVFAYIGLEPNIGFLPGGIGLEAGALRVGPGLETSLGHVFAVGAVRTGYGGQLIHAAEDARVAVAAISERLGRAGPG